MNYLEETGQSDINQDQLRDFAASVEATRPHCSQELGELVVAQVLNEGAVFVKAIINETQNTASKMMPEMRETGMTPFTIYTIEATEVTTTDESTGIAATESFTVFAPVNHDEPLNADSQKSYSRVTKDENGTITLEDIENPEIDLMRKVLSARRAGDTEAIEAAEDELESFRVQRAESEETLGTSPWNVTAHLQRMALLGALHEALGIDPPASQ